MPRKNFTAQAVSTKTGIANRLMLIEDNVTGNPMYQIPATTTEAVNKSEYNSLNTNLNTYSENGSGSLLIHIALELNVSGAAVTDVCM
jgi:hypothetical protein